MADHGSPSPLRPLPVSPLAVGFWVLVCAAATMVWLLSGGRGMGGDPAGNGMSTGLIQLFVVAVGVVVGAFALLFLLSKRLAVRLPVTILLGLLTMLLLTLVAQCGSCSP